MLLPEQNSHLCRSAFLIVRSWSVSDLVVAGNSKVGQNRSGDQREGVPLRAGSFLEGQPTNLSSFEIWWTVHDSQNCGNARERFWSRIAKCVLGCDMQDGTATAKVKGKQSKMAQLSG